MGYPILSHLPGISRDEELPQEAEVKMLRAERATTAPKSDGGVGSGTGQISKTPQDVSKELALINCFKELALKHQGKLGFAESKALSRDQEVVAKHVPELLQAPKVSQLELEVEECF
eukprot:s599_g24.t1